jgi:PBP1b-binding outer membrane lipoprotein LpoB
MKWLALMGALMLVGCSAPAPEPTTKPVVIQTQPVTRPPFNPPPVEHYQPRDVDWMVVNPQNVDEIFARMQASGEPMVLFAVTENGYENIAINNREALRVILQQQTVINGYREYYVRIP